MLGLPGYMQVDLCLQLYVDGSSNSLFYFLVVFIYLEEVLIYLGAHGFLCVPSVCLG
jgi:hypothetical protein